MTRRVIKPTTYNKLGQRSTAQSGVLTRQRFLASADERTRVRQLEQQVQALASSTESVRAEESPRIIELVYTAGQTQDVYMHSFGRPAKWKVVDWLPNSTGQSPNFQVVAHPNEANMLRIRGANAGTVKIEVY